MKKQKIKEIYLGSYIHWSAKSNEKTELQTLVNKIPIEFHDSLEKIMDIVHVNGVKDGEDNCNPDL